jgi:unsaturated rhamnogalacturonyl hydrolase
MRRALTLLAGLTASALITAAGPAARADPAPHAAAPADWSGAVIDSTMKRKPSASDLGGWGYQTGLFLWGTNLVYQRTHNAKYLSYVRAWVDRFVDSSGKLNHGLDNLDSMEAGNLLVALYKETHQAKYKTAATQIRNRLKTYPRTSDGGFFHATSKKGQLWGDGTFMIVPFLIHYGQSIGEATYTQNEAAKQLLVYGSHLQDPTTGLLYHAYDETGASSWADPKTHHSSQYWCRAIGWYGMATTETLKALPVNHPDRAALLQIDQKLIQGMAQYQDPATGRWFQVVNRGDLSANWTETSCSAMYSYTIDVAVQQGWVDPSYQAVADRGYQGVLKKVSVGSDGLTNITDICVGTNVGDLNYYLGRDRATNDFHGLGAFLIANEQFTHPTPGRVA